MNLAVIASARWFCAGFVILAWGVTFVNTRALLQDFSALEIQILRFALAWCVLGIATLARGKTAAGRFSWREESLFVGMGFSGVAVYQFLENCAIYYTNASNVAILVSFGPIVTAVLARVLTRDRSLSFPLVAGSLVAVCGVALVALNGVVNFQMRPIGDMMALGAMISWGFYSVLVDKANAKGVSPMTAIRKAFFWALVLMMPLVLWGVTESGYYALDGSFSITLDTDINIERFLRPLNWLNIVFLGAVASAACFVMWNFACKQIGVVRTTIGLYLTPIVGVIFAAMFLGERLTAMSATGGVVIILGVVVANWGFWRDEK